MTWLVNGLKDSLIYVKGVGATEYTKLTDHNRSALGVNMEEISNSQRTANGTMRKNVIAQKHRFDLSWKDVPNMSQYTVQYDRELLHEQSLFYLKMNWDISLHLKPYYSFCPKSMWNVLECFKNEIGRREGKNKELKPPTALYSKTPMYAVIEWGDKLGGIHAHALLKTWLSYEHLEDAWFNANLWGSPSRKLKLLKQRNETKIRKGYVEMLDLSKAENPYNAVRYNVANELKYSLIDTNTGYTSFVNDFVFKKFGDFKAHKY